MFQTDDVRINKVKELLPPVAVLEKFPATEVASSTTFESRKAIHNILEESDDRLLVIVGPCSIHDTEAALEYGKRLKVLRDELGDNLEIVMRVYTPQMLPMKFMVVAIPTESNIAQFWPTSLMLFPVNPRKAP